MMAYMAGCILLNISAHRSLAAPNENLFSQSAQEHELEASAFLSGEETGHVKQIAFKTTPRVGKVGGPPSARPERIQGHGMIMQVFPTEQQPVL